MPTCNRRPFVGQAIHYFLRQEYQPRELIVIDDGEDAVTDLIPPDERIRYVRLPSRHTLGAKRNLACEISRGDLIAHWDDDDWIAPRRLSVQVAELLESDADVCGTRDLLCYAIDSGEAWQYHPDHERPWLAGGTLLYRRSLWTSHRFLPLTVGEDSAFVWQCAPERMRAVPDPTFYVALLHRGNTAAKNLGDPHWKRIPLQEVSTLLARDREYYVGLRSGHGAATVGARRSAASSVTISASLLVYDGYGSMAEYLIRGIARAGATVNVAPLHLDMAGLSEECKTIVLRSQPEPDAPVLYFSWPSHHLERYRSASDLFINTMWESSRLPSDWPAWLNRARAVIVPTSFVADVCRISGVTTPIEVLPEGIDPAVYYYIDRPPRSTFTTLIVGTLVDRKHTHEAVVAWKRAFAGDPEARLIIKARFRHQGYRPDDPRISFVDSNEATRGIAHWYARADVLLALGNEGFGLPLVEGMATGLPVIALNSEGQAAVCATASDCLIPITPQRWQAYDAGAFGRCGVCGVPDIDQVAASLRWVATHRDEARAMGRAAAEWVPKHHNVWSKGSAVLDLMERAMGQSRPLRRAHTLWVPSWRTNCGIAEYTAHLVAALPVSRASRQVPDASGMRVLHVQHEPSLFRDNCLWQQIRASRQAGVPVAITEHRVEPLARAWEHEADALVALTREGAELLGARLPDKHVEWIPPGCPTWFPARKSTRGKMIGAFGFLKPHKGFWHLLDMLPRIPGSELSLFGHAQTPEMEERWAQDANRLPVRWDRDFLAVETIASRLAAEADILVFWYDEAPHISASYAVRIGLASGVPVLTSPTGWFRDLREVTYQPHDLVEGVQRLLEDTPLREHLTAAARDYCHMNSWPCIAKRHQDLWQILDGR
jgi:glycosyltransferase involved in cell wall biosynthesis